MKTAEEYIKEATEKNVMDLKAAWVYAINEARKEAIEECAKRADILFQVIKIIYTVDKQHILNLIDELK